MTTTQLQLLDQQKGKVDRSALLGRLMWYSVPEVTLLDHQAVVAELTALGIAKALPGYPEEANVFRRASKAVERRRVPHGASANEFENWMVRNVAGANENIITRRIVVEIVDPVGRKLDYAQVADVEFDRNQKALKFSWLNGYGPWSHPTAEEMMREIRYHFHEWQGKLHDQSIRDWIRRQILAMGATPVRPSGGVYFLEERFAGTVEALEAFVSKMLPAGGECHSVEIPDNDKQREMVRRAIENETVGEIERMLVEIANIRNEGHLTPTAYVEMLAKVRTLESKMDGYSKLLEKDLSSVRNRLKLLDATAKSLSPLQAATTRRKKNSDG